eukprot:139789-Pyramimonas_sp.AAC.1
MMAGLQGNPSSATLQTNAAAHLGMPRLAKPRRNPVPPTLIPAELTRRTCARAQEVNTAKLYVITLFGGTAHQQRHDAPPAGSWQIC